MQDGPTIREILAQIDWSDLAWIAVLILAALLAVWIAEGKREC